MLSSWGFCISYEVPSAPFRIIAFYKGCVIAPFGQQNSLSGLGSSAAWGKRYGVSCCYRMQWLTCTWLSSNRGCEPNVSPWTPKEALRVHSLGRTRTGLNTLWCLKWQNAVPAFEGSSRYSLWRQHFSVSGFKHRQMIAIEDMANEPAPSGSPVTHTVPAPGRWCYSPWCQCLSRTHGKSGIAATQASATATSSAFYLLGTYPHLSKPPSDIAIRQGYGAFFSVRVPRAFQIYLVSHAFAKIRPGCLPAIMWKITRRL